MDTSGRPDDAGAGVRALLVVLLAVAASAVVAVAATGTGVLLPPLELDEGRAGTIRLAAAVVLVAGVVVLAVLRRRRPPSGSRGGPDPTVGSLLAATVLMGMVTLLALLAPAPVAPGDPGGGATLAGTGGATINPELPPPVPPPPPSAGAPVTRGAEEGDEDEEDEPDWQVARPAGGQAPEGGDEGPGRGLLGQVARILLVALLVAAGVAAFLALRGRPTPGEGETAPGDGPVAGEDAVAGLEGFLARVTAGGGGPRRQITAAYGHLLEALAAAGAPRRPQEAPYEHLRRALGPLGVPPEPMHRLAEMYVVAQFSEHPVTEDHRAAAVEALDASLASLRAAGHGSGDAPVGGMPEAARV